MTCGARQAITAISASFLLAALASCSEPSTPSGSGSAEAQAAIAEEAGDGELRLPLAGLGPDIAAEATDCSETGLPSPSPLEEPIVLAAHPERAVREGRTLRVGRFSFTDPPEPEESLTYRYAGRLTGLPVDLVLVNDWDSVGWTVLDQESGTKLEIGWLPIRSPDGRHFALGSLEGVRIVERTPQGWKEQASFDLRPRACSFRWASADLLTVTVGERSGHEAPRLGMQQVVRQGGRWSLTPEQPKTDRGPER
jgi:hypothetical protein